MAGAEHAMRTVTFHVSSVECAVPVDRVREILEPPPVTRVPGASPALLGVTNLRGQVLPVLDVAVRLGVERPERPARSCLLVADRPRSSGGACALCVDAVTGIEELDPAAISPPPAVLAAGGWLAGIVETQERLLLLVDLDRLLDETEVRLCRRRVRAGDGRSAERATEDGDAAPSSGAAAPSPRPSPSATPGEREEPPARAGTPAPAVPTPLPVALSCAPTIRPADLSRPPRARGASRHGGRDVLRASAPAPVAPSASTIRRAGLSPLLGAGGSGRGERRAADERAPALSSASTVGHRVLAPATSATLRSRFRLATAAVLAAVAALAVGFAVCLSGASPGPPRGSDRRPSLAFAARPHAAEPVAFPAPTTPRPAASRGAVPAQPSSGATPRPAPLPLRPGDVYEVARGDTLWSISGRMLLDPYAWPELYDANRKRIDDPDLILPGQQIVVPEQAVPAAR